MSTPRADLLTAHLHTEQHKRIEDTIFAAEDEERLKAYRLGMEAIVCSVSVRLRSIPIRFLSQTNSWPAFPSALAARHCSTVRCKFS